MANFYNLLFDIIVLVARKLQYIKDFFSFCQVCLQLPCLLTRHKLETNVDMITANWEDLPFDIIVLVAQKIQYMKDFLAFRQVCLSWRSAATKENFNGTYQLPWLLVRHKETNVDVITTNEVCHYHIRSKCYEIYDSTILLPFKNIETICLGWKGWILVVEENGNMNLLHAFSPTSSIIKLPNKKSLEGQYYHVAKAALSSNPFTNPSDYTIMITFRASSLVTIWRPGDESFTKVTYRLIEDVISYGGLFYLVADGGFIMVYDTKGIEVFNVGIPTITCLLQWSFHVTHKSVYLAESTGEFLIVERSVSGFAEMRFRVFILIQDEWWEVDNVGNRAIFVGFNTSFFVDGSKIPNCRVNCIYFTDYEPRPGSSTGKYNMGVYDLLNGSIEYSHRGNGNNPPCICSHPPMWLTPTFF